ncbi:hypothetical protein FSO04_40795 [Paraburkholderia madseniana]|uniref:HTH rpiR-type domain-containing protein n=1 Tax=Paraburkholderia madseniana TaxID=2599607 RepID=A0A6N6W1W3_9BURK|nr:hypothetical protein FSO04_40795 [Paraburkholderia madseniana]
MKIGLATPKLPASLGETLDSKMISVVGTTKNTNSVARILMDPTSTFSEYIEESFARLTPAQQQMARYILDHKEQVAFRTAKQLAEDTGQSDAAVIRFAQAIGYGGYMALRESLRESLLQRVGESGIPEQSGLKNEQELKCAVFETDAALVQQTARRNADETVSHVANMIVGARRVYISAHGTSYSLAFSDAVESLHRKRRGLQHGQWRPSRPASRRWQGGCVHPDRVSALLAVHDRSHEGGPRCGRADCSNHRSRFVSARRNSRQNALCSALGQLASLVVASGHAHLD